MKRLLLILSAIFIFVAAQAQTLKTGDVVSISFKNTPWSTLDYYTYMEASTSGILSKTYATDDCLWVLEATPLNNGGYQYAFKDLTTGKYLAVNYTGSNQEALKLSEKDAQGTLFSFTETEGEEGKYMYGQLYYNTVTHWGQAMPLLVSEYGGTFLVAGWNAYDLYIEKWELKGAGKPTGHFKPSKIEFSYIGDQEGDLETDDDPRPVQFMIEATTESYYKCIRRPDEALLRRTTGNVDANDVRILNVYWESTGNAKGKSSVLDKSKYTQYTQNKVENRELLSITHTAEAKDFTITPVDASPMDLQQLIYKEQQNGQTVGVEQWVDYADNVVVEYQYGSSEPQEAKMRVVRKAYHEEELPTLTFSINPLTYTFNPEQESKVFTVVATHQHGDAIYNVDNQIIDTTFTVRPEKIALTNANLNLKSDATWITASRYNDTEDKIIVTAEANNGDNAKKRSAILTGTLTPQREGNHVPVSFTIPLDQRAHIISGGIQFVANPGQSGSPLKDGRQQVHTVEKTIYYTPNQEEIELRLQESGYSGYMRWYDYETGGDPYYNYTHDITGASTTSWVRSPRGNNNAAFSAINTPRRGNTQDEMTTIVAAEGHSHGLYSLNKADGGALDEDNPYNPNPIIKPWADGAYHIMACDVSAYTDYEVKKDQYGQIDSITEPTLSYRQIFHLRPAQEMADKFAALGENEYLEEYKYQAPAGKQILLATEYRYKKFRSHLSEMCYFYWANGDGNQTWIDRIADYTPVVWREFIKNPDGSLTENTDFRASYSAEMDYLIVRSDVYPATKVYTLELPGGEGSWVDERYTNGLRIARFEVEFVDIEKQGPTPQTIITQQRINSQYKTLTDPITFDNITTHLPWEQASYGYVYDETTELGKTAADGTTKYKRGASQGCFPFYGEYTVLASVDKGWAQASAHGGTGKSLYVDGTMEPGLVASIEANATICTGQTMYCSAWFCNPTPSGWSGEGNPIFRCNIQGRNKNENGTYTPWEDAGVYFVGELLKGTGWQQVVFPIESAHSYDQTRVSIYNFATTNQGNDFMVDDINLYVSQLPIAAYQGKMACRTTGDGSTTAAAILRLDYSNITAGSDGYMYYQIYNESFDLNDDGVADGAPVNLTDNAAYYHDNEAHNGGVHDHSYGSVTIPAANYNPENDNKVLDKDYFYSVSKMLDYMADNGYKKFKAYVKTENSGVVKWLLYVAHFVENVSETEVEAENGSGKDLPLQALYDQHEYTMRMAYSPNELDVPACNMQTPLHATQKTVFRLRNSDGDVIKHDNDHQATKGEGERDINRVSTQNCANDLYFLTAKIINNLSLGGAGGSLTSIEAPIYADWLVGEDFDDVYNDGRPATGSEAKTNADAAFKAKYGYTRGQIASAVMYDMRRIPTDDEPNPNYTARSLKELQPSAFESYQNYAIVKHLCDSGWLQMYDTTVHFYLGSNEKARYWCFPIEGTAKYNETVTLKDCNEPRWVSISSQGSNYYLNLAPIKNTDKTLQQKTQIPAVKVLEGSTEVAFSINELSGTMSGSGKEQVFTPNVQVGNTITIDGKSFVRLNLEEDCELMDMELGKPSRKTVPLKPGQEYTVRLQLKDLQNKWDYIEGSKDNCRVGYVFVTLQVVPKNLVWSPDEISFTGWGLDDNWKGWSDKNDNGQVDEGELVEGFVPISGANVIIPKLDNALAYPYIVHEDDAEHGHKHNHYPMTIDFQPHHCNYIYFAPGAKLHNQHVLQYNRAFVDMQITAGKWNMMSAPLQDMVSGDMFIPHEGDWRNGRKIDEPNPFEVSTFKGRRDGNAAYTFAQAFYNTSVDILYEAENGVEIKQSSSLEFTRSNTMAQALTPGTGYQLYGLGKDVNETLTIRLPKTDEEYYYYTTAGTKSDKKDVINRTAGLGKLAYTPSNDVMEITLQNEQANTEFLFGNPTMAYIDMRALYEDNPGVWSGNFKRMTNSSWISVTQLTMASERYLAPMTSVLLESTSSTNKMQITLKPSHLTLNNTVNPNRAPGEEPDPEQSPARRMATAERPMPHSERETEMLTIYALNKNAHARTVLATNPAANDYYQAGEDALFASTGVERSSAVTSPLNMYTVAEQVPMMADVRQGISQVPLAILAANNARSEYMQVAFYYTSNWSRTCYFCDSKTGQKIRIMDGLFISVEMPLNHEQRYYIEGPDDYLGSSEGGVTTSTTAPTTQLDYKAWAYSPAAGTLVVSASDMFQLVRVYDMAGRILTDKTFDLRSNTTTLTAPTGVCIVETVMRDGTSIYTQAIVK